MTFLDSLLQSIGLGPYPCVCLSVSAHVLNLQHVKMIPLIFTATQASNLDELKAECFQAYYLEDADLITWMLIFEPWSN